MMRERRTFARALAAASLAGGLLVAVAGPAHALGTLSIGDASTAEGTGGSRSLTFTVTATVPNIAPVTVDFATTDGTAVAGSDYVTTTGTATIATGQLSTTIVVPLVTDAAAEPNETFTVTLTNPSAGTVLLDSSAVGTIENDDGLPLTLSIDDPTAPETDAPTNATFTVTLSGTALLDTTVDYLAQAGTATSGADFAPASGTATILAGASSTTIPVAVVGDDLDETDETFTVTLSAPVNANVADGSGTATIVDDDAAPVLSVDAPSVAETDGDTPMVFTATLDAASGRTVSVNFSTTGGTATVGDEYDATSGTLIFPPATTELTITVPLHGDNVDEPDETIVVTLSSPVSVTLAAPTATGTIVDDEGSPALSVADTSIAEGTGEAATDATVTITLSEPSGQQVEVDVDTSGGTATVATDYAAVATSVIFSPGTTTRTVVVPVVADPLDEANETVGVVLTAPQGGAVLGDATAVLTITDDDATPSLSIADAAITEGDAGNTILTLSVNLSAPSGRDVSFNASTDGGTAVGGADYATQTGTALAIAAGATSATLDVSIFGDTIDEADETFTVVLAGATNATVADGTATITITDDDDGPVVTLGDASAFEGTGGADTVLTFTATLSAASQQTVTAAFATADATATAGATADYDAKAGTVTFTPGQTVTTLTVNVNRDTHAEPDESFLVALSAPTNATLAADSTGTGTIQNDDGPPSALSIADLSASEGVGTASLTITLAPATSQAVLVDVATVAGTATAPADFTATTSTVTIAAGQTSATFEVPVIDDNADEVDQQFTVQLANARNATIGDASATVTITDNDIARSLSIADANVTEGDGASLTVTITPTAPFDVTVHAATANGTATATADYTATSVTVTIPAGQSSAPLAVPSLEDALDEPDETLTVELTDPSEGPVISDATAVLTILDDDGPPSVSIADQAQVEGDAGSTPATFTATLSAPSGRTITVRATTTAGTAGSSDFTATDVTVTFVPGDTTETVAVPVTGDTAPEADETFAVALSLPTNVTVADGAATGTITDDEAAGTYFAVTPTRLLDTRSGVGRTGTSPVDGGDTVVLDVTGVGPVPATGVQSVVVNLVAIAPAAGGFLSATPTGGSSTSNVNYRAGEIVANLVVVPVGPDGSIRIYTHSQSHLAADVFGWFASDAAPAPGSHQRSVTPDRVLDTRDGLGVPGGSTAPLAAGTTRVLDVTGVAGVPATGVSAVIVNVTVTGPSNQSFLSVTPTGGVATSNINFDAGETAAGLVIVPVGPDGSIRYAVGFGTTHVVADVFGWFATPGWLTGSVLTSVAPARILDTRDDPGEPLGPQEEGILFVTGSGGVPADGVEAAILNLTVDQPTAPSFLAATPDTFDGTSNLNFVAGQTVANLAVVPLFPDDGGVSIYNNAGSVHVIVDVFAWFSSPAT